LEESQRRADTDLERFRAGLRAYVAFGIAHPDEYRLTFLAKMMASCGPGRPADPCGHVQAADRSFDILANSIAGLMQAGIFRQGDLVLTAEAVWASLHGVTALLLDQREHLESETEALVEAVIEIAVRGLAAAT
jgi:AcrR family transcriptional regulator